MKTPRSGEVVPTWDYLVATVRGRVRAPLPHDELVALLDALAARHEALEHLPWSRDRLPPGELAGMLDAIVGLALEVEQVEVKAKLSQNRSVEDRARVARDEARLARPEASKHPGNFRNCVKPSDGSERVESGFDVFIFGVIEGAGNPLGKIRVFRAP